MGGTLTKKDDAGFGGETQQDEPATITAQLWENLPNELKIYVLSFLTPSQLIAVRLASSFLNDLCDEGTIWRNFYKQRYGEADVREFAARYFDSDTSIEQKISPNKSWKGLFQHRRTVTGRWFDGRFAPVVTTLYGHNKGVRCARFDSENVVSGGGPDKQLIVWDLETGAIKKKLADTENGQHQQSIALGENILPGKVLTGGGSDDKSVCIWDLETEKLERRLLGALGWVPCICFDREKIVASGEFGEVCLWDLETGTLLHTMTKAHTETIWKLQFDDQKIVTVSHDTYTKVWDLRSYTRVLCCQSTGRNGVYSVKFDDTKIASGSKWSIDLWDVRNGKLKHSFTETSDWVLGLDFDGDKLISGGYGNKYRVQIYDLHAMKWVRELQDSHVRPIRSLQFSSSRIVTASLDHTVKVWDFDPRPGSTDKDSGDEEKIIHGKRKKIHS